MKKIVLLLAVVLLLGSLSIPVSAEEKKYTATVCTNGIFAYIEERECIIGLAINLYNIEEFTHGEIIFRYNPSVIKGVPDRINIPQVNSEKRFTQKYITEPDCTIIQFKKNEEAPVKSDSYSPYLPFQILGYGEHELSVEVFAYNEKNEKVEYDVVFRFALYDEVIANAVRPIIDESKLEMDGTVLVLQDIIKVREITEKFDGQVSVIDCNGNFLDSEANIPNGAFVASLYNGYVADTVSICVIQDVNCDAKITAADARLALRYAAKIEYRDWVNKWAADVNRDGTVAAADARSILRKAAGLE